MPYAAIIKMLLYWYAIDGCGQWDAEPSELEDGSILEETGKYLTGCASMVLSPLPIYENRQVEAWADALLAKWEAIYAMPKGTEV